MGTSVIRMPRSAANVPPEGWLAWPTLGLAAVPDRQEVDGLIAASVGEVQLRIIDGFELVATEGRLHAEEAAPNGNPQFAVAGACRKTQ